MARFVSGRLWCGCVYANNTEDILIGVVLSYAEDAVNQPALDAIMALWTPPNLNNTARIAHLSGSTSGGNNGGYVLNGTTITDDGVADTLYGDDHPALLNPVLFGAVRGVEVKLHPPQQGQPRAQRHQAIKSVLFPNNQ